MSEVTKATAVDEAPVALERRNRTWLWVGIGAVLVVGLAFVATSMLGQSVVYYRTPTEVKAAPGQIVRLAGTLVADSVVVAPGAGTTTFSLTDGTTTVDVVYAGTATTAITTASQPGTQLVAEGTLGTDGVFTSQMLMAKCPSKFQAGGGDSAASQ